MKTVTIKTDAKFDALLNRLAVRLSATKSSVIRDAVRNYDRYLDQEDLCQKILSASLITREQATESSAEFDIASADGL